jgi:hypothetical protein
MHCELQSKWFVVFHGGQTISVVLFANAERRDNYRDDCFYALRSTLRKLQEPSNPPPFAITAAVIQSPPPTNNPITPPGPSPRMATSVSPAISSSRVSPASYDELLARDDPEVYIKQEQHTDGTLVDSLDRSHLRKDSHFATHTIPKEQQPQDKLPPFSSFQPSASLAQVPSSAAYGPILPRPSIHNSPSANSSSSPQSPYATSIPNGNDQQTVMMSPSVLHPPLSIGPRPTTFPTSSFFHDSWSSSRPSPSSPDT